jgi:anaerobic magnesium-protoporphyrin IX monomethyl ester cyclase
VQAYRDVLERLGDHHAAHLDLAAACFRARMHDDAEMHARKAAELGLPTPGLAYNVVGCVAAARGDLDETKRWFERGAREDPWHAALVHNAQWVKRCEERGEPADRIALGLIVTSEFQILERTMQPTLPGPLEPGWDAW